jgi:hypothetical protein
MALIGYIRKFIQGIRSRAENLAEARLLLEQMAGDPAYGHWSGLHPLTTDQTMNLLMGLGMAHLRGVKASGDCHKAAREMELRIAQGPRPSYQKASLN